MKSTIFWPVVWCALAGYSGILMAQETIQSKKLIEWGWDEPDTRFMRDNIATMEQMPFSGLVFHINNNAGTNLAWDIWSDRRFDIAEFSQAIEDMKATPFDRLSDRFLRVNVTPGYIDWYDDRAWAIVLNNFRLAAILAREGGAKGFMFDVEQYKYEIFNYDLQKNVPVLDKAFFEFHGADYGRSDSFAKYQNKINDVRFDNIFETKPDISPAAIYLKIRQRGQEWMNAVAHEFPDIVVFLTFGYTLTVDVGMTERNSHYKLIGAFLDGMLDVAPTRSSIIDGYEQSYRYTDIEQFSKAYNIIKGDMARLNINPEKYRQMIKAAFGLYMDANWAKNGWNVAQPEMNYFSPEKFERAVGAAMAVSDQYVWIYSEQPNWWTRGNLPQAYVDALRNATRASRAQK